MVLIKVGFIMSSVLFFSQCASWGNECSPTSETLTDFSIDLLSYKAKNEKGKILILPPTGGATYLDKGYARSLCKIGFSSMIIKKWSGIEEESLELNIHAKLLGRAQKAIAKVLEEKTQAGDFIGILGTSVGAIHSATALGIHDKIQTGFLILGGAPIHKVIAYSDEETLKKYRQKRMKAFDFQTVEEYAVALSEKIPNEVRPLFLADKVQKKDTFSVIALKDKTVLSEYQKSLAKAFQSESLEISSSHIPSIIWFYFIHFKKVTQFFETSYQKSKL